MSRHLRGLQIEIVANLFVVMLAGLAIVGVVLGSLAVQTVQRSAFDRLELASEQLERTLFLASLRLSDLAALVRSRAVATPGEEWLVLDQYGRPLFGGKAWIPPEIDAWVREARQRGPVLAGGGLPIRDLWHLRRIQTRFGDQGYLLGRLPRRLLWQRILPLLGSGTWVLLIAATVFVTFGSYLLRIRIVAPVQRLSDATRRVAIGDLAVRIDVSGSDELAELSQNFNEMAASLLRERDTVAQAFQSLARSQRLATVGQLAAGVAHEVGNPVAAIMGYTDVALRDRELASRPREALERIRAEVLRVRALVRQLLDLARPEQLVLESHAPADLLSRVAQILGPQKILDGIAFVSHADPQLPRIVTDARQVGQILINLVENAAHALRPRTEPVPAEPRIELRAQVAADVAGQVRSRDGPAPEDGSLFSSCDRGRCLVLEVHDNGPGILEEHLQAIFDPFFTTRDPGEGTGLGLWNAHRLADLLGGRLEVESRPGRTCFSLILPIADSMERDGQSACSDHRR